MNINCNGLTISERNSCCTRQCMEDPIYGTVNHWKCLDFKYTCTVREANATLICFLTMETLSSTKYFASGNKSCIN